MSHVTWHVSLVMSPMSHVSMVSWRMSHFVFRVVKLVGEGSVINRATLSNFLIATYYILNIRQMWNGMIISKEIDILNCIPSVPL